MSIGGGYCSELETVKKKFLSCCSIFYPNTTFTLMHQLIVAKTIQFCVQETKIRLKQLKEVYPD